MTATIDRSTERPSEESPSPSKRRRRLAAGAVALLAVAAGATAVALAADDSEPSRNAQQGVDAPAPDEVKDLPNYRSGPEEVNDLPRYRR